jgi:hypothetical protein
MSIRQVLFIIWVAIQAVELPTQPSEHHANTRGSKFGEYSCHTFSWWCALYAGMKTIEVILVQSSYHSKISWLCTGIHRSYLRTSWAPGYVQYILPWSRDFDLFGAYRVLGMKSLIALLLTRMRGNIVQGLWVTSAPHVWAWTVLLGYPVPALDPCHNWPSLHRSHATRPRRCFAKDIVTGIVHFPKVWAKDYLSQIALSFAATYDLGCGSRPRLISPSYSYSSHYWPKIIIYW